MRLYVIWTLRFFFHMGSVECVTFHVPSSHSSVGGVMAGSLEEGRLDGARRIVEDDMARCDGCAEWGRPNREG